MHIYPIVRVALDIADAKSPEEAIQKADKEFNEKPSSYLPAAIFADDIDSYLVDTMGGRKIVKSADYDKHGQLLEPEQAFDASDLACVLAGLRMLQDAIAHNRSFAQEHFAEDGLEVPDAGYLDQLCERINCAGSMTFKSECDDSTDLNEAATLFPRSDWQYEVANGDTKLNYNDWLKHRVESER